MFAPTGKVRLGALAGALALAPLCQAGLLINPGWDLLRTDSASFDLDGPGGQPAVSFVGNPIGTFDFDDVFNRDLGIQNVGGTDTIIRRVDPAMVAGVGLTTGPIAIEMVALSLVSANPVFIDGMGTDLLYVSLVSGTGTMNITFNAEGSPHGTFASNLNVTFDIHYGAPAGPVIVNDGLINLSGTANNWAHEPEGAPILVNGVNRHLNGTPDGVGGWIGGTTATDFFVIGVMEHDASGAGHHNVVPTPEPLTTGLAFSALMLGAVIVRKRRTSAAPAVGPAS